MVEKRTRFFSITAIVICVWALLAILFSTILDYKSFNYEILPMPKVIFAVMALLFGAGQALEGIYPLQLLAIPFTMFAIIGSVMMKKLKKSIRILYSLIPAISVIQTILYILSIMFYIPFKLPLNVGEFFMYFFIGIYIAVIFAWLGFNIYILSCPKKIAK